ncbi:hypothetical protein C2W62_43235 [Candidatus Entotheonella serta]|nr:hypothetical protein C2W62_43235 [Candidatus Entotheonella serta]
MAARRAVGDNGNTQQVIQTQRGRGYRFIAQAVELSPETENGNPPVTAPPVSMKCPSCAQHVPLPAAFCLHCGSPLDSGGVRTQQEVPLIGREHKVARLQAFLQEAQAGKGQVVDIVGEPSIGKSRLVDHLRQLSLFDGVTFVHVFCSPVRVGPPGEPIRDVLRQCCGLSATDGRAVVVQQLTWWLSQLDIEPDDVMPYLLHVLTFSETDDRRLTQQPALLKVQALMALRRILVAYSRRQPLVIAVEDIQWLDQTSADCLSVLTLDISDLPVLLLSTRRPDIMPRPDMPSMWYERSGVTSLPLHPLGDADRMRLLQAILSTQAVVPKVELALLARAEGHPGFLTQLAQWYVDVRGDNDSVRSCFKNLRTYKNNDLGHHMQSI